MNDSRLESIRDEEGEALLTLVMPVTLADLVADWMLEQPQVQGFISLPVNGHGAAEHHMTAA
jgi:hypothetical protein